jgi:hypothetical protein
MMMRYFKKSLLHVLNDDDVITFDFIASAFYYLCQVNAALVYPGMRYTLLRMRLRYCFLFNAYVFQSFKNIFSKKKIGQKRSKHFHHLW